MIVMSDLSISVVGNAILITALIAITVVFAVRIVMSIVVSLIEKLYGKW